MKHVLDRLFRATMLGLTAICLSAGFARAGEIEVIFTEIPGHATAQVPNALDLAGMPIATEFKALEDLTVSPDGTAWLLKARNTAGSDLETMLLLGSGLAGDMFAQEGQQIPTAAVGELYDFFDSAAAFNENGVLAFGARARGGDTTIKEKVMTHDSGATIVNFTESTPCTVFADASGPVGDESFGNSLNGIHILNDGTTLGFVAVTINNISSFNRPALFYNTTAFLQSGFSMIEGVNWDSFDSDDFFTTPDGAHWYAQGDDENADTSVDDILVVDGVVVVRENSVLAGTAINAVDVFDTEMLSNGDWFSRGDDDLSNDWAMRNGVVFAATGEAIIPGTGELWGDAFLAVTGNRNGQTILVGNTNNADPAIDQVVVFNGEQVVVREGDPVDVDGNGAFDDDAFIGRGTNTLSAFAPNDFALTDDNVLYFIAPLRDSMGNDLGTFGAGGEALLRIQLPPAGSAGNVNQASGTTENPLTINGSTGGNCRTVNVGTGLPITVALASSTMGPVSGRYALWVWPGNGDNPTSLMAMGSSVGTFVNPTPVSAGMPQPVICIRGTGIPPVACGPVPQKNIGAAFTPWMVTKPSGFASPTTFILQGLLEDAASAHPSGFSVTNAVILNVQ